MRVTRYKDAKAYDAPGHYDMTPLRLHGAEAGKTEKFICGLSHFEPGGGAEMSASNTEKVYFCIEGEITVELDDGTQETLGVWDSCHLAPGEARAVKNLSDKRASMVVVVSL